VRERIRASAQDKRKASGNWGFLLLLVIRAFVHFLFLFIASQKKE
jgi:hypothetical protein